MNSTTVHNRYLLTLAIVAATIAGAFSILTTQARADTPAISNIVTTSTDTGATINWNTGQNGSTQVLYGTTSSYGASTTLDNTQSMTHMATLGGLTPGTLYHFEVMSGNASGTMATSSDMTFTTTNTASSTATTTNPAPMISGVIATPSDMGATVSWNTDINSNSQVLYGTTNTYGSMSTLNSAQVTNHLVTLSGLTPNTMYHFQVLSAGTGSTTGSTDMTFTTMSTATSTGGTGTTTDLQNQINALTARVAALEAEVAALMGGNTGGTTTPPTTGSGMLDQSTITVQHGGSINFGGRGFPHEENIVITLNGNQVGMAHADGGGNFSTGSMMAPSTPGTYTYVFTGSSGGVTHATVTVQ